MQILGRRTRRYSSKDFHCTENGNRRCNREWQKARALPRTSRYLRADPLEAYARLEYLVG